MLNLGTLRKTLFFSFILIIMCSNVVISQNRIDFGLFYTSTPNQLAVKIRPNYTLSTNQLLTNVQFTIRWPVSSGITEITSDNPIYPYIMLLQGSTITDGAYYYQIWATPGGNTVKWTANAQITIQTFTYTGSICPFFEIAHDAFVQNDTINGDYYIEINGASNLTGSIYYTAVPAPTGSAVQYFCSASTVADLVANGPAIKWYSAASGGSALLTNLPLVQGTTYYGSQTINGVESTSRLAATAYFGTNKTFNLKLFFEGLYAGNGLMNETKIDANTPQWGSGIADKITVDLHNAYNYSLIAYQATNVNLSTSGNASLTIPCTLNDSYYIAIKNRNNIETVSSLPVSFAGNTISYNFSSASTQAYHNNLMLVSGGYYAIYSGDLNQDGIIDGTDLATVDNASSAILKGFNIEDVDGDGTVDGTDLAIVDNNASNIIKKRTP